MQKVMVTAYKNHLIIIANEPDKDIGDDWVPIGPGKIGCVLSDTKKKLGVSQEALDLMQTIPIGHDAIGDIDWFAYGTNLDKYAFAWMGGVKCAIEVATAVSARTFRVRTSECTIIPNNVPEDAKEYIDSKV